VYYAWPAPNWSRRGHRNQPTPKRPFTGVIKQTYTGPQDPAKKRVSRSPLLRERKPNTEKKGEKWVPLESRREKPKHPHQKEDGWQKLNGEPGSDLGQKKRKATRKSTWQQTKPKKKNKKQRECAEHRHAAQTTVDIVQENADVQQARAAQPPRSNTPNAADKANRTRTTRVPQGREQKGESGTLGENNLPRA